LKVHVAKVKLAPNVDLDQIAGLTPGFTGADIANLVNEAAIVATRRNGEAVTLDDFTLAIERIIAGLEKRSRILSPEERRRVAYHEMGHALVPYRASIRCIRYRSFRVAWGRWATPCNAPRRIVFC
jgi:cell division protease FtsH